MSTGDTIAIIGLATGSLSAVWMTIARYGTIRELIYANKRDLAHANNNATQANKALLELDVKVDLLECELTQTQTIIQMLLAERGQTSSDILGYKRRNK